MFEEMEAQIKNEKDRLLLKVPEGSSRRYSRGCLCSKSSGCHNFTRLWSFHISPSPTFHPDIVLLAVQDSERLQLRSLDLECQLSSKEKELESLFQKQKKVREYSQPRMA